MFNSLIISLPGQEIRLKPENEDDYVEYKLRLDSKTKFGKQKLLSQLNYRLDVGKMLLGRKEAHYVLGICDDGTLGKLNEKEIDETFSVFSDVISKADASIVHLDKKKYNNDNKNEEYFIIYAIVQKIESFKIKEINIAFVGPSQHGKTTTISHLVFGQHDDGNGYSRNLVFKHEHEKVSGLTSSVKKEIIGLRKGKLINYSIGITTGWQDIVEMSEKVINLIDLPGNMKYSRSIFFGLSVYQIDAIVIVIDLNKFAENDQNEILFYRLYAETFNIPYKLLIINDNIEQNTNHANNNCDNNILFSNLSNFGLDDIIKFMDSIDGKSISENTKLSDPLFCVMETYYVPDAGTIFSGIMKSGSLSLGDNVFLTNGTVKINFGTSVGVNSNGNKFKNNEPVYYKTKVKSIHRKQIDSRTLYSGETGAIQLEFDEHLVPEVNKHMIITNIKLSTYDNFIFELLNVNQDRTTLKNGQMCVLFVDNIITNVHVKLNENRIFLNSNNKIILPSLNDDCIAFLKYDNGVLFGKLLIEN